MKKEKVLALLIILSLTIIHYNNVIYSSVKNETTSKLHHLSSSKLQSTNINLRTILFWGGFYGSYKLTDRCIEEKSMEFCPFKCEYTVDRRRLESSDAVVIHGREWNPIKHPKTRAPKQYWTFLMFESPDNSWQNLSTWKNIFNWTMSYRADSDIPIPYGKVLPKSRTEFSKIKGAKISGQEIETLSKKKLIAWAASNCGYVTSGRMELVEELSQYTPVDKYGDCGQLTCIRGHSNSSDQCSNPWKCHQYLGQEYKFYLAFENSICEEYVTEKFFNSLKYGMVPVVHGPPKDFYLRLAPADSFIHVADFNSIMELAEYLIFLGDNPKEYLKYFEWKNEFVVDNINYFQRGWCSLCEKLHSVGVENSEAYSYPSIEDWWFYKNDSKVQGRPCRKLNIQH